MEVEVEEGQKVLATELFQASKRPTRNASVETRIADNVGRISDVEEGRGSPHESHRICGGPLLHWDFRDYLVTARYESESRPVEKFVHKLRKHPPTSRIPKLMPIGEG